MLKIPSADDVPPALVAPRRDESAKELPAVESTAGKVEKRRKHGHGKRHADEEPEWEKEEVMGRSRGRRATRRLGIALAACGLFFIGMLGVVALMMARGDDRPVVVAPFTTAPPVEEEEEEPVDLPEVMKRSETEFFDEARPLARKFLEARTIAEMLPLVRNPEEVEPKMKRQYPDGVIDAPGMSPAENREPVNYRGKFASMAVRTRDQEVKQLAFTDTPDGLKIDWESYVGWSDMTWEEFLKTKPTKPQIFRVMLKRAEYYNFNFANDVEWQSYRLVSPDGEHLLYGYVKRDSPVNRQVKPDDKKSELAMTLSLKFRPGETSRNQVVIDRCIDDGWVKGIDDE